MTVPLVHLGNWAMLGLDIAAWAVIHAGTGYAAHRLSAEFCDRDTWVTALRRPERSGRAWRVLRVHAWKDRLPEAGAVFAGGMSKRKLPATTDAGLRDFAAATRRAEMGHWMAAIAAPVFVLWNPLWITAVMVVYGLAVNAPFIAIQRYNRLRISSLLDRRSSRRASISAARDRRASDTTGNSIP